MVSDVDALTVALTAAATAPAILDALARACWHNERNGADCPDDAIPSESDLCEWLPGCPPAAQDEATIARSVPIVWEHAAWITKPEPRPRHPPRAPGRGVAGMEGNAREAP